MKVNQLELPDRLIAMVHQYVEKGYFRSDSDVVRAALLDFVRHHDPAMIEQYAKDDIAWALEGAGKSQ